jgi:hypothetical protein
VTCRGTFAFMAVWTVFGWDLPSLPFPNVCSGRPRKVCVARNDIVELTRIDRIGSDQLDWLLMQILV